MRRSAAVSAMLRTMKLWREPPSDPAASDHGVELGEPLLVPLLRLKDAGDVAEIHENSKLPLAALARAIRAVSGHQPRLCGPRSALSTNIKRFL